MTGRGRVPAGGGEQEEDKENNKAPYYGGLARVTYVAMVMIIV